MPFLPSSSMMITHNSSSTTDNTPPSTNFKMVEYYAKECYHCQHLAPTWKAAVHEWNNNNGIIQQQHHHPKVEWIQKECYGHNWQPGKDNTLCKISHINAFPDIRLYETSNKDGNILHTWKYEGDRSVSGLIGFVNNHVTLNHGKQYYHTRGMDSTMEFMIMMNPTTARMMRACTSSLHADCFI